jgi:hypothetical protein
MLLPSAALPLAIAPRESDQAAKSTKNLACGSIVHAGPGTNINATALNRQWLEFLLYLFCTSVGRF